MSRHYNELKKIFAEASISSDIEGILHWDMATMMPNKSRKQRAMQLTFMAKLKHNLLSGNKVNDLIQSTKDSDLNNDDKANFLEMKREHLYLSSLPSDLVQLLTKTSAECEGLWQEARKEGNFKIVQESLQELITLIKSEASILSSKMNCSPYESLVQKYEPLANVDEITKVFGDLKLFLKNNISIIIENQKKEKSLNVNYKISEKKQFEIAKSLMSIIGFDFERGRLDKSEHPFCVGATDDIRITTRYNENDPFSSLEGVMHETGHAMYELGLPNKWQHQPVGKARGMAMHESQSLLIEMQITRSLAFKKFLSNFLKVNFKLDEPQWSSNNLYTLGTRVNKTYIRVEADEVTYPLHIIMRFNIEKMLIENKIDVKDIPFVWNEEYKNLFDINVDNDMNGCLQDIHWYAGLVGYFPTYSLGALASAQFSNTMRNEISNLDSLIEQGNFKPLMDWLKTNIHEKASFFSTNDVLREVTNSSLDAKYFKQYIINRYL